MGSRHFSRKIYRKLGDREKYLELRHKKLKYGDDYHDLAPFYWDEGSRKEAIAIATEGMKNDQGRMDGVQTFLSDRALEEDNREQYLALHSSSRLPIILLWRHTIPLKRFALPKSGCSLNQN
jgi:hypothetical protein